MDVAINAVSAKRGGSVTYLQNVLPPLQRRISQSGASRLIVWRARASTGDVTWPSGIEYREDAGASGSEGAVGGTLRRLWFDQVALPNWIRSQKVDALFSSANFGPLIAFCHHVLLVRNPVYFDAEFMRRASLKARPFYELQRFLTLRCIARVDTVLFPTQAMLNLVASHAGGARGNWRVAHYGTRHDLFRPPEPRTEKGPVHLLNVSLYSDQKNFGTLLSALKQLHAADKGAYKLSLTAGFGQDWLAQTAFFPNFARERDQYRELAQDGIAADVDWKRYTTLPELYRSADIFVFPSYTESFGHPLLEAMASGLPIVAADVPVNRELCGEAAVYFPSFDSAACAAAIRRVAGDSALRARMTKEGLTRVKAFTWDKHTEILSAALTAR